MKQLEEGHEYNFFVEKLIDLPDGKYFILRDEWERKYLLPQIYYTTYNIKEGMNIICNVNKINCNGKVFLEPQHPIYKVNDVDTFTLKKLVERIKQKTKEPYYVILSENSKTDKAAVLNYTAVDINKLPIERKCRVIKIKKGELQLEVL
jgi:hypothetical protein